MQYHTINGHRVKGGQVVFKGLGAVALVTLLLLPFVKKPTSVVADATPPASQVKPAKPAVKPAIVETYIQKHQEILPDFASIRDVKQKKEKFFAFMTPYINAENARLAKLNKWIHDVKQRFSETYVLTPEEEAILNPLFKSYRIKYRAISTEKALAELIKCVDELPKSLVLMQAANESAWGTSRFARLGLNFFGKWCYTKGCGVVPNSRPEGKTHEVQAFKTVEEGVQNYFKNINTATPYALLRDIRAQFRANNLPLQADVLATGLVQYSSRGDHYVNEISQMIRYNERFMGE